MKLNGSKIENSAKVLFHDDGEFIALRYLLSGCFPGDAVQLEGKKDGGLVLARWSLSSPIYFSTLVSFFPPYSPQLCEIMKY